MAVKRKAGPTPTGWTLKTVVRKDGSKTSYYYCPGTGQRFNTYFKLMRYVKYAKREGLAIYSPSCKSIKRIKSLEKEAQKRKESLEKDSSVTQSRKTTSVLSLRRKPDSYTFDDSMDSESSSSSESSDREKDPDFEVDLKSYDSDSD